MKYRGRKSVKSAAISKAKKQRMGLSKRTRQAVKKVVKQTIKKTAETKWVSQNYDLSFNNTIGGASECYPLCPTIAQGVDDFQRLGDSIRAKYLVVRGKVQYNNAFLDTAATQFIPPVTCRLMVLSQKNIKVSSDVQSRADVAHLLKDNVGTGTARPYSSSQYDNLAPINLDLFQVHLDKKIKFNWINHQIVVTDPGVSIAHDVGNDRTKYFYLKIKLDRNLKFDDGNANYPNSFAPFMCFGAVCDDGSSPWTASTPFHVTCQSTLWYTDM